MKKKVLLSSIITIALCLSLIAGSTFALFTHSQVSNIAVTAGKVNIIATLEDAVTVYSANKLTSGTTDNAYLKDAVWGDYEHVAQSGNTFANGGSVTVSTSQLTIDKMTPGDRVDCNVNIANSSNVAIAYRYVIKVEEPINELAKAMVICVMEGDVVEQELVGEFGTYTSDWVSVPVTNGEPDFEIPEKTISILLPIYAGNDCQDKTVNYTITVEAVQGNAIGQ